MNPAKKTKIASAFDPKSPVVLVVVKAQLPLSLILITKIQESEPKNSLAGKML